MSADNQMVVLPWGGVWATYMHLGEYPYTRDEIARALFFETFYTRESAINYASRVCEQEVVEYGLRVLNNNPKKEDENGGI